MKIDYNKFPVLQYVKYGNFRPTVCLDDLDIIRSCKANETFKEYYKSFQKVYVISQTFHSALEQNMDKLWDILSDENDNLNISGTYIFKRDDGITETYCFDIDFTSDKVIFYYFQGDKLVVFKNGDVEYVESSVIEIDKEYWKENTVGLRVESQLLDVLFYHLFYKFAEIETKIIKQKTKYRSGYNCVYNNQTDLDVTYLNSTWFTNLVKSDAFKVSGHFRLQPCKDENGLPTRKIIWISDYVKSGYTAPARKLKEAN